MSDDCGCCEGIGTAAPDPIDNPPGRAELAYRVGTYATFFRAMVARLGRLQSERGEVGSAGRSGAAGCLGESHRTFTLGGEPDAGTALLDGWACIADVLTFYQERIANEGYLRTATERRSVVELGQLTGYEPRPGVAASVHLAFTVQDKFDGEIPAETRVQSMPRPGQTAQTFETSEAILARAEWNAMRARPRAAGRYIRREYMFDVKESGLKPTNRIELFLAGVDHRVRTGDVILLEDREDDDRNGDGPWKPEIEDVFRVTDVWPDASLEHTTIRLVPFDGTWERGGAWDESITPLPEPFAAFAATAPRAAPRVRRTLEPLLRGVDGISGERDAGLALVTAGRPALREHLMALMRSILPEPAPRAYVMRSTAQVFGHNASVPSTSVTKIGPNPDHPNDPKYTSSETTITPDEHDAAFDERAHAVFLAGNFSSNRVGEWLVIRAPKLDDKDGLVSQVFEITSIALQSRRAYGLTGEATRVELSRPWWRPFQPAASPTASGVWLPIHPIRQAIVHGQAERLALVGEPIEDEVKDDVIDLAGLLATLPSDRLLIVEGERSDVPGTAGLRESELVRVAAVEIVRENSPKDVRVPFLRDEDDEEDDDDEETVEPATVTFQEDSTSQSTAYTRLTLTAPLAYRYKRGSVVIRGNVAHATHGETRDEVLGSGDASTPDQRFTLRQGPRTWISAPTPTGIASTLAVRVSGILWPEVPGSSLLGPRDEVVRTRTLGDGRDELRGGDGHRGVRFPTGIENLTARYRVGIGAGGNVDAGLITALVTRPMGVREVVNPCRASGGADPDGRDEIRARIPIAARGIDRLVSVQDHADLALNFAGIETARARYVSDPEGGRATVDVVIAGDEDVPIEEDSDLLRNLRAAFHRFGDPTTRVVVRVAEPVPLLLQASVRIDPRHEWVRVEAALRERLLARMGWAVRAPGQAAHLSVVFAALQSVPGVVSIDVDVFQPAHLAPPAALQWSFAADAAQIFYFARSAPDAVAFLEMVP